MTSRTLSEISATCSKAARGAGCPWGMAEEAGLAARRLSAQGLSGAEAVAALLTGPRQCACTGRQADAPACGLAEMVALLDAPPTDDRKVGPVAAPLLLLGFALADDADWTLNWPGGAALCGVSGVVLSGALPGPVASVTLVRGRASGKAQLADWRSRPVDAEAWAILENLAAKLLVPESDGSRARGAGPDE